MPHGISLHGRVLLANLTFSSIRTPMTRLRTFSFSGSFVGADQVNTVCKQRNSSSAPVQARGHFLVSPFWPLQHPPTNHPITSSSLCTLGGPPPTIDFGSAPGFRSKPSSSVHQLSSLDSLCPQHLLYSAPGTTALSRKQRAAWDLWRLKKATWDSSLVERVDPPPSPPHLLRSPSARERMVTVGS